MRKRTVLHVSYVLILLACACGKASPQGHVDSRIAPYVGFLEQGHHQPVEYVLDLFEAADLVVLCERVHPEMTQYEFFFNLLQDERFQREVGHVFTEIGSSSSQAALGEFLHSSVLEETEAAERLNQIYEDLFYNAVWPNYNLYDFLRRVQRLNSHLPISRQVTVYPSDVPLEWEGVTAEGYTQFVDSRRLSRDRIIADQVIQRYREIGESDASRKKALVIMNYRHAFTNFDYTNGRRGNNVAGFLMEAFPGQVANVMLNSFAILPESVDSDTRYGLIQEGRWDAAFHIAGDPDVGFDFEGSPFGEDQFDYFPLSPPDVTYEAVFRGFVFYKPLAAHRRAVGLPGLYEGRRADLIIQRLLLIGAFNDIDSARAYLGGLDSLEVNSYSEEYGTHFDDEIARWLRGNERMR
jgi:hypothetical protein